MPATVPLHSGRHKLWVQLIQGGRYLLCEHAEMGRGNQVRSLPTMIPLPKQL